MRVRSAFLNSILKRRGLGFGHDPWGHRKAFSVEIVCLNLDVFKVVIIGFFFWLNRLFFLAREHVIAANHFRAVKQLQGC